MVHPDYLIFNSGNTRYYLKTVHPSLMTNYYPYFLCSPSTQSWSCVDLEFQKV